MTVVKSNYEEQPNHLYETPYWAVEVMLKHVPVIDKYVWEPAAGNHRIADMLYLNGAKGVFTSDIAEYNRQHSEGLLNFLDPIKTTPVADAIITNPPYGRGNHTAAKFCRLALQRCDGWVAMLLTAKFDFGSTRVDLFRDNERFHKKITLIDRLRFFDGEGSQDGTEDHAWYIWRPVDAGMWQGWQATVCYEGNPYK